MFFLQPSPFCILEERLAPNALPFRDETSECYRQVFLLHVKDSALQTFKRKVLVPAYMWKNCLCDRQFSTPNSTPAWVLQIKAQLYEQNLELGSTCFEVVCIKVSTLSGKLQSSWASQSASLLQEPRPPNWCNRWLRLHQCLFFNISACRSLPSHQV